jgi:GH25 family lysozyme M1 (1,4-beta-N-acetylmuramidase)
MNKASKALWTRKLNYRLKRLQLAKKKGNAARVSKWTKFVVEARAKLNPVVSKPKPAPKPKPKPPVAEKKLKGVDVYEGDLSINWSEVKKAGYEFVFCKTSEGGDWSDPTWNKDRVDAIRKADIKLGVYHFLRPRADRTGAEEMKFFIEQAKSAGWGKPGDLRPVIDFEETTLSDNKTIVYLKSAIEEVKKLTGKAPIIYTGGPFWDENTRNYDNNFDCPLWLAAYVNDPDKYLPAAWKKTGWSIWQHTDKGSVPGIKAANVDQNISKHLPTL